MMKLAAPAAFDRRGVMDAAARAGLALGLVPLFGRAARADTKVSYFTWAGYELPEFHPAFTAKYGADALGVSLGAEDEEFFQKVRGGFRLDLVHPCKTTLGRFRDAGLIEPMDVTRLSNWPNVWPELTSVPGVMADATHAWYVPWEWGNASVIYRTDLVDPQYVQEESWSILFDERYKGRLATFDSVDGAVLIAARVAGIDDIFHMTDAQIATVKELLAKQKELLRFYWTDQATVVQAIASGELVAAYAWNDAYVALQKEGLPVKYMNPKEGIFTWFCGFVKVKDGPGDEQAIYDFLDARLATEGGKYLIEQYGYGHANRKSFDLVDPARLVELGIGNPGDLFTQGIFFDEIEPELREKYITMFEEVKAGS
ncbi:MAG: extracellular solute-binding protein [Alphaproteobacteria bacterium]|nr:extracellular solute-binding protein [Alphaproteobacteria bacterium]